MSLDGNVCCAPDKGVCDAIGDPAFATRATRSLARAASLLVLVAVTLVASPLLAEEPRNVDTARADASAAELFVAPPRALGTHPAGDVRALAFAPGGARLAGLAAGTAVVWELVSGQVVAEIGELGDGLRMSGAESDTTLLSALARGLREVSLNLDLAAPAGPSWLERLAGDSQVSLDDSGRRVLWWRLDGTVWFRDRDAAPLVELLRTADVSWGRATALGDGGLHLGVDAGELVVETLARDTPVRLRAGSDVPDVFATTADGRWLALPSAGANDMRQVEVWDLAGGTRAAQHGEQLGLVQSIAFDAPGARLAVAHGKQVEVWGVQQASAAPANTVLPHTAPPTAVAFVDDHGAILTGDDTGTLRLWSLSDAAAPSALELTVPAMCGAVACRVESLNVDAEQGSVIASLGRKRFGVWSLPGGKLQTTFSLDLTRAALSGDGSRAFLVSSDGGVVVLDTATGALFSVIAPHRGQVFRLWPSRDGEYVLLGYGDETYGLVQVRGSFEVASIAPGVVLDARSVAFAPGGRALAYSREDGAIDALDPSTGLALFSVPGNMASGYTHGLAFSPDGALLAVAQGSLRVLDASSGDLLADLGDARDERGASVVQFAPDGRYMAWGNADGQVYVGELATPAASPLADAGGTSTPPGAVAPGAGGCACSVTATRPGPVAAIATLVLLGLLGILRRRTLVEQREAQRQ